MPNGITSVTLECWGAGGNDYEQNTSRGGYSKGDLAVASGDILYLYVGGVGYSGPGRGGWNGGGAGGDSTSGGDGWGGGGASDVRHGGNDLAHRVIVAGGGGGSLGTKSGYHSDSVYRGGYGGGTSGGDAANQSNTSYGVGATQATGYALGVGGDGQSGGANGGGGGGGGYYGGLGGQNGSTGGGGGSGYIGGVTNGVTTTAGASIYAAGKIVISYPRVTLNLDADLSRVYPSDLVHLTWNSPNPEVQTAYKIRYRQV